MTTTSKENTNHGPSLEDLSHDPSQIDSLNDKQIIKLAKEANESDIPLAGNLRSDLNSRANAITVTPDED